MLETTVGGLVIAALTGIAVLAYQHPDAFGRLLMGAAKPALWVLLVYYSLLTGWILSGIYGLHSTLGLFPDRSLSEESLAIGSLKLAAQLMLWGLGIAFGLFTYIAILAKVVYAVHYETPKTDGEATPVSAEKPPQESD